MKFGKWGGVGMEGVPRSDHTFTDRHILTTKVTFSRLKSQRVKTKSQINRLTSLDSLARTQSRGRRGNRLTDVK